jgi:hypothetical protein
MKMITLRGKDGEGKVTIVDDDVYERVKKYKYSFHRNYAVRFIYKNNASVKVYLHKEVLSQLGFFTHHINGNKLDNRLENLRLSTASQSMNHRRKWGKTKFKGVHKSFLRFQAIIYHNKKTYYLGSFSTEKEAAIAYNKKAKELLGEFAELNEIS